MFQKGKSNLVIQAEDGTLVTDTVVERQKLNDRNPDVAASTSAASMVKSSTNFTMDTPDGAAVMHAVGPVRGRTFLRRTTVDGPDRPVCEVMTGEEECGKAFDHPHALPNHVTSEHIKGTMGTRNRWRWFWKHCEDEFSVKTQPHLTIADHITTPLSAKWQEGQHVCE